MNILRGHGAVVIKLLAMAALVASCGGGSGGNESRPNNTTQNPFINTQTVVTTQAGNNQLDQLIGDVSFTHTFNTSGNVFIDRVTFNRSSYSDNRDVLIARSTSHNSTVGCAAVPTVDSTFLCIIFFFDEGTTVVGTKEYFLFTMTSSTRGEGIFESCTGAELPNDVCSNELASSPDGTVVVAVNRAGVAAANTDSVAISTSESLAFKHADDAQFGKLSSESNADMADAVNATISAITSAM